MNNSLKQIFKNKFNIFLIVVLTVAISYLYYLVIDSSLPFEIFIKVNDPEFVIFQILFSVVNSFLTAISLVLFIEIIRERKKGQKSGILSTLIALGFSIGTTGCYVCGSILLPFIGIATSFASLPFGGLEIKFITALLLIYSIRQLLKVYSGLCEIRPDKKYILGIGENKLKISQNQIDNFKPIAVSFALIALIFVLPIFFPQNAGSFFKDGNNHEACPLTGK